MYTPSLNLELTSDDDNDRTTEVKVPRQRTKGGTTTTTTTTTTTATTDTSTPFIAASKTSKFRGVCWLRGRNVWRARIEHEGARKHLGYFVNETEAARAYDRMAIRLTKSRTRLNFPLDNFNDNDDDDDVAGRMKSSSAGVLSSNKKRKVKQEPNKGEDSTTTTKPPTKKIVVKAKKERSDSISAFSKESITSSKINVLDATNASTTHVANVGGNEDPVKTTILSPAPTFINPSRGISSSSGLLTHRTLNQHQLEQLDQTPQFSNPSGLSEMLAPSPHNTNLAQDPSRVPGSYNDVIPLRNESHHVRSIVPKRTLGGDRPKAFWVNVNETQHRHHPQEPQPQIMNDASFAHNDLSYSFLQCASQPLQLSMNPSQSLNLVPYHLNSEMNNTNFYQQAVYPMWIYSLPQQQQQQKHQEQQQQQQVLYTFNPTYQSHHHHP